MPIKCRSGMVTRVIVDMAVGCLDIPLRSVPDHQQPCHPCDAVTGRSNSSKHLRSRAAPRGDGYKSGAGGSGDVYGDGGATPVRRADIFVTAARARMPRSAPSMEAHSRRELSRATSIGTR